MNPESGTISYLYDNNGNLTSKTDARGVKTDYVYDALSRVTNRNYSLTGSTPPNYQASPNVTYFYDNLPNAKGKLTKVSSSVSTTEYTAFDILGRVTAHKQTTDGGQAGGYTTGYMYNLSGALIEETYPSGRVVKNTLDNDGELQQVQSSKSQVSGLKNYANAFTYNAAGAVSSIRLGNGKWENTQFNSRLQPTQIGLGASASSQNLLKLNYTYNTNGNADNNGNILSQTITAPTIGANQGFTATQTYTYDSLNRIKDAVEVIGTTETWRQTFLYDRFGNRNFDTTANRTTTIPAGCSTAVCNPSIDPTTNKLIGYQFDNAGNTKIDANGQIFTYDSENKQVEVKNASSAVLGQYSYDGDGKRIKKIVPSTGETTIFVYDASGKLVAEYSTIVEPQTTAKMSYLANDHLGSPRLNTDALGNVTTRHDYHPFGEEISTIQRTGVLGYADDTIRKQFAGYERDRETDLDFAEARMYFSSLGRFTSPDPLFASAQATSPKTWNRYAYARNNPLKFVDPSGLQDDITDDQQNSDENAESAQTKRRVYVFVFLTKEEQQRTVTFENKKTKKRTTITLIGAPNFESLKKNAPKGTEVIIKGVDATLEDFTAALKDKDATGVIFIGHGSGRFHDVNGKNTYVADDLLIDPKGGSETYGVANRVDVNASFIGVFGCDGTILKDAFEGASSMAATYSGKDGLTSTAGIAQAGFAAAKAIISGQSPDEATAQANSALIRTNRTMNVTVGRNRVPVPGASQDGDRVLKYK
jgi:RHS repeat-associated protein